MKTSNLKPLSIYIQLLILSILLPLSSIAQDVLVIDLATKMPIEFVSISQPAKNNLVYTNDKGFANISKFDKSSPFVFYYLGYKKDTLSYKAILEKKHIVALQEEAFVIHDIVVSAERWEHQNGTTPQRINQINQKAIERQNPQTAADLLGTSGEIFIQKSQQGGGSPMIRGFAANRLVYAVDGIRMNTAIFRSGNLQNVISIDPFSIQKAQVLFGPGSVFFGSDAIGGVMAFSTLTPKVSNDQKVKLNFTNRYSSANNELSSHLDVAYGNEKISGLTSFTYNHFGDLKMGKYHGEETYLQKTYVKRIEGKDSVLINDDPYLQRNTGFDMYHFMQKVKFQPNENFNIQTGLHYSTSSNYDRYDRLIRTRNGDPRYAEWYYGPQKWLMANIISEYKSDTELFDKMVTRLAYQQFQESRIDRDFNDLIKRNRQEHVDAISLNIDFTKTISDDFKIGYGFESVWNKVNSEGFQTQIQTLEQETINPRYPNSDWTSNAVFGNASYKISNKVIANAGLRFNHYSLHALFDTSLFELPFDAAKSHDLGTSMSLGLAYRPSNDWYFAVNVSSGFRAPNVDDMGKIFDSTPGNVVVPNPSLQSEKAYNLELSLVKIMFDRIRLDMTGFFTKLKDGMVRRNFSFLGQDSIVYDGVLSRVQSTVNAAQIEIYGIQSGLEIKLPQSFKIYSRLNWQYGEEELDNGETSNSRHVAPIFGLIQASKSFNKFYLELNWQYSGGYSFEALPITEIEKAYLYAKDKEGNPYSPSWSTFNVIGRWNYSPQFSINFSVENILDRQYRTYSSGLSAAGRNYIFSLTYRL